MKLMCAKCDGRGVYPQDGKITTCDKCNGKGRVEMTEQEKEAYLKFIEDGGQPLPADEAA
jgi:DnaJ-class molecular chaperone